MLSSPPVGSLLGLLLIIALIYLVFKSPKKLRTLVAMALGFIATILLITIPGAMLRIGDPR